ncbi:MAG: hypothetical protein RLZ79_1635, partial [Pseudomonadota bacterium]
APTTREHDCGGAARQIETGHDIVANHWETLRPIFLVEIIHFGAMLGGHIPTDSSTGFVALRMTTR